MRAKGTRVGKSLNALTHGSHKRHINYIQHFVDSQPTTIPFIHSAPNSTTHTDPCYHQQCVAWNTQFTTQFYHQCVPTKTHRSPHNAIASSTVHTTALSPTTHHPEHTVHHTTLSSKRSNQNAQVIKSQIPTYPTANSAHHNTI
jgi:hypothetical protein